MINREDLEFRLITTLAPMLLTMAVFALSATSVIISTKSTIVDEILLSVAGICIFAAALLMDAALDKLKISFVERVSFLGGGYLVFCVAVASIAGFIPVLYDSKRIDAGAVYEWNEHLFPFFGAGASVFMKMMVYEDKNLWAVSMLIFAVWTTYTLSY